MLPDVPWLRPDVFIHRHLAMIASRNCRSSRVMSSDLSRWRGLSRPGPESAFRPGGPIGGHGEETDAPATCRALRKRIMHRLTIKLNLPRLPTQAHVLASRDGCVTFHRFWGD